MIAANADSAPNGGLNVPSPAETRSLAHQAWFEGTVKPILPPGADAGYSYVHVLGQVQPD